MSAFQLDECFNDKRVAAACNAVGKCELRRWPKDLLGVADDVWFPDVLTRDAPVVTTDRIIALEEQNRRALPMNNSGIILVKSQKSAPGFGSRQAAAVIEIFKEKFPDWHVANWSDIYVEITEVEVYVCDFKDETLNNGMRVGYVEPDFQEKLWQAMNSARTASLS